jgi:hypothetical protein
VHRLTLPFALLLAACHGSTTSTGTPKDGSSGDDSTQYMGCPDPDPPKSGTDCSTSPNTHCQYQGNACMPPTFVCDDLGKWEDITDAEPPIPCPGDFPAAGSQCTKCLAPGMTCGYDAGCMGGAGILSARCDGGVWESFCAVPEAGTDAGGDDAGDATTTDAVSD